MCFWKALFSALGRPLGTQGVQEAPKWSQNELKIVPEGTLWEALEPLYLLYGRHMGRSRACSGRQLFSDWVYRPSLEESWGEFLQICVHFGCPLGSRGFHFGVIMVSIFEV